MMKQNEVLTIPASRPVRMVCVADEYTGQRLDNFLKKHLKGVPLTRLYRLVRKGEVRVNSKRVKVHHRLQTGDTVRIPPVRQGPDKPKLTADTGLAAQLHNAILYEDHALLVLNKPSGLAVHGGSGIRLGLIEAIRSLYPKQGFFELVHRLDRDTSGCIIVAKKRSALTCLQKALQTQQMTKWYQALVVGSWKEQCRVVNVPLQKNILHSGERMVKVDPAGKPSVTHFSVQECFMDTTLLSVRLLTGRTHQIRVHTQYAGHPIVGDEKYGFDAKSRQVSKRLSARRLFLHAARLEFNHPDGSGPVMIQAPLPESLQGILHKARLEMQEKS